MGRQPRRHFFYLAYPDVPSIKGYQWTTVIIVYIAQDLRKVATLKRFFPLREGKKGGVVLRKLATGC